MIKPVGFRFSDETFSRLDSRVGNIKIVRARKVWWSPMGNREGCFRGENHIATFFHATRKKCGAMFLAEFFRIPNRKKLFSKPDPLTIEKTKVFDHMSGGGFSHIKLRINNPPRDAGNTIVQNITWRIGVKTQADSTASRRSSKDWWGTSSYRIFFSGIRSKLTPTSFQIGEPSCHRRILPMRVA